MDKSSRNLSTKGLRCAGDNVDKEKATSKKPIRKRNNNVNSIKEEKGAGDMEKAKEVHVSSFSNDICVVCSAPASKSCSACQIVKYCSADHQKSDWNTHKKNCCPYTVKTNAEFGRHLVAARGLKAGTLVIEESPIMYSPRGMVEDFDTPICLSCCTLMEEECSSYRCSKCNWPCCSLSCERYELHAKNECKIFSEQKIPFPPQGDYPVHVVYKVIELLRGVLIKEENPDLWSRIKNLQNITDLGDRTILFKDLPKLRQTFGVENIGTEEDWLLVLGILNVNNFTMQGTRGSDAPSFSGYVFIESSMFAHSCAPNCSWMISMYPNQKMCVRTNVDIKKGEALTIAYSSVYNAFGTHKRQELIKSDGEFICKCIRCVDQTELNSFASALICTTCKSGNVLPINPICLESDWKCDTCNELYYNMDINKKLEGLLTKLEECTTLADLEQFVKENQNITLHSNHWLITEAENVMCQQRTRSLYSRDEISLEEGDAHIAICEHLLKVKNIVAPGYSLERARLLNYLARARFEKLDAMTKQNIPMDPEEVSAEADFIYLLYDEALNFYKNDITEIRIPGLETVGIKCRMIMSDMKVVSEKFCGRSQSPQ